MSDLFVEVETSKLPIVQRYHVVIKARNGEKLFTSENYHNKSYADKLADEFAEKLEAVRR